MRPLRVTALAAALSAAAVLGGALATVSTTAFTGAKAPAAQAAGGWTRYHSEPVVTYPAGQSCDFEVKGRVVQDAEYTRVFATFGNGDPKVQEFVGPLIVRFTNVSTGRTAVRDLSGSGHITYGRDGSQHWRTYGRAAFALHPGDHGRGTVPDHKGIYVTHDRGTFDVDAAGHRVLDQHGYVEDLCPVLAR